MSEHDKHTLLSKINSPKDLRELNKKDLPKICKELRDFIIDHVSVNGGHLGASLGVVELTVALHFIFDTPNDRLIWDVGHQAYGHKILTGRRDLFHTNRKYKGISGFPKIKESEFDAFGVGHASTSISAALGMAEAAKYKSERHHHIAVIGDGAMTGGLAFEGMNHSGVSNSNLLIVLNDNGISIDENVGALKHYLTDITTSKTFNNFRNEVYNILGRFSKVGEHARDLASSIEMSLKSFVSKQSNLFESLNLRYFGPVDGHDIHHLTHILQDLKDLPGPKLLHCLTKKGKGYYLAENDQTLWHAPGTFDKKTGNIDKGSSLPKPPKYQDVFGLSIIELAKKNDKIFGITPAMPSGSSMKFMLEEMPNRSYDVGIAEQHAVTFSAGLATQGIIPFCNIYSSFMQRAYDQMIHDVCLQNLHVIFCIDRGGLVGADGPTHHGVYDIAYMRCIPNLVISSPLNEQELRNLMYSATLHKGPYAIRYPRGHGEMIEWKTSFESIETGKANILRKGKDFAILTFGPMGNNALKAANLLWKDKSIDVAVYNMRFVKPLDKDLLHEILKEHKSLLTIEDGTIIGGLGSAVLEFASENNYSIYLKRLGVPDRYVEHGEQKELFTECGYNLENIMDAVQEMSKTQPPKK